MRLHPTHPLSYATIFNSWLFVKKWRKDVNKHSHLSHKDLEIGTVKIPRPINLDLIKENINCPINIEIDTAQHKHEENKKCNSKFKCLNKDLFDVFYDDYIDFKNYINDTLKTNYHN